MSHGNVNSMRQTEGGDSNQKHEKTHSTHNLPLALQRWLEESPEAQPWSGIGISAGVADMPAKFASHAVKEKTDSTQAVDGSNDHESD